jgi:hypothetical protein
MDKLHETRNAKFIYFSGRLGATDSECQLKNSQKCLISPEKGI